MDGAHRHGWGSRRGSRPLGHGDLRLLISETPRHGYDLIQEIEARSASTYKPRPGVMCPALKIIQDLALAEVHSEKGKKTFRITARGKEELVCEAATVEAIHARLADLMRAEKDADPADVRTAMHRLWHAFVTSCATALPTRLAAAGS